MLITVEHAARELGVSESTIRRHIKEGKLEAAKAMNTMYVYLPGVPITPEKPEKKDK